MLSIVALAAFVSLGGAGADPGAQKSAGGNTAGLTQLPNTMWKSPSPGTQSSPGKIPGSGATMSGSLGAQLFLALDKNKDGIVTEEEFFGPQEKRFDALDKDHDRILTKKEFESGSLFGQVTK